MRTIEGLVDSHCHINFDPLGDKLETVLSNAREHGINHMLCVSVNMEDLSEVITLAENHRHIFASVGVHPNEREGKDPSTEELVALASNNRVVAIGETGLDYFRSESDDQDYSWQQDRFRRHIEASKQLNKPLIIHTRAAADDTMSILEQEKAEQGGGVMHCFAEDWQVAQRALDIGFYISFSGIVTFKNAKQVQEVAQKVPLDRMLVETDSPYLAPMPYRGKTNEPAYTRYVANHIAELRGLTIEQITQQTTNNFFTLFNTAQPVH